jgi:hypothetical protein
MQTVPGWVECLQNELEAANLVIVSKTLFESKLDEIGRLREALKRISSWCPATQDITLAHQMAQEAESALS